MDGFGSGIGVLNQELVATIVEEIGSKLNLTNSDKLLEVGCGAGMLLIPLSKVVKSVSGVDMSTSSVRRLKEVCPEFNLFISEANNLPFENETYNKLLVHSVFHYFPSLRYAREVIL